MSHKYFYAYARHALVAGLRHLEVGAGDEIGVPEFICRDLLASVAAVGAIPKFYPVDELLRPLCSGAAQNARFVLFVNYFGFAQDMERIQRLWPDAVLIEDNAHGYLSKDSSGADLGTRTSVAITSFRKTIRVPDGAYLHTATTINTNLIAPIVNRRLHPSFQLRYWAAVIERLTSVPMLRTMRRALRFFRHSRTGHELPDNGNQSESILPLDISASKWTIARFERLDNFHELNRRRDLFKKFLDAAKEIGVQSIFDDLPPGCCPYGFPFIASETPIEFEKLADKLHCEIISWPDLPSCITVEAMHFYRRVKLVNFL